MVINIQKIVPDICAFLLGVGIAWYYGWQTTDLVWSLWLGSLVLGYITILSTIIAGIYIHRKASQHPGISNKNLQTGLTVSTPLALFLLVFFTLHFGGFHAVHAMLLNIFFPIDDPGRLSTSSTIDPTALFTNIIYKVIPYYGLFLIPLFIAERKTVFAAWRTAKEDARSIDVDAKEKSTEASTGVDSAVTGIDPSAFITPYKNVVRMHLLIFVFAICQFLNIQSYWIFILVYFVYFFPWRSVIAGNINNTSILTSQNQDNHR